MTDSNIPQDPPIAPPKALPWVTITLAVLNVGVFGWQIAAGADPVNPTPQWLIDHGGNFPVLTLGGEPWRLLTSMFLHVGLLHLAMNMIGLVDGGRHVEKMYGRAGFIALYLVAGLAGSLASALRGTNIVSAGASGAIFGVFGAFGAFLFLHRSRLDPVETGKQARGLLIFLAYNVFIGLSAQGIDLLAHAGGLVAGFACGIALEYGTSEGHSTLKRSVMVGLVGVGLVVGGVMLRSTPPVHVPSDAEINAFNEVVKVENRLMKEWGVFTEGLKTATVEDGPKLADRIENELVAPLQFAAAKYERAGSGPIHPKMLAYLRAREASWQVLAQALRTDSKELAETAVQKIQEANALQAALNKSE